MLGKIVLFRARKKAGLASFTLIELLTVMVIIAILASLILAAGMGVMAKAARSRASSEVQAMSTALEGYKTDNGIYPPASNLTTNTYTTTDWSLSAGQYQMSSQLLFQALAGVTNFTATPVGGTKTYMAFKGNQVGDPTGAVTGGSYVKDPWNYSYGYSTGTAAGASTTNAPYNGSGFFDLWSTGGITYAKLTANNTLTNAWISNWQ